MYQETNKKIKVVITSKFNCQSYPLNDKAIEITQEELEQIGLTKCFDLENNCVIDYDNSKDVEEKHKQELRAKREPLLKAFDVYKTNIDYGVETETDKQHTTIVTWYRAILDLDEKALDNVPAKVAAYL